MAKTSSKRKRNSERGFSLLELLMASVILITGILGSTIMIVIGISRDNANQVDTTATNAAQTILEQIASASASSNATISVTDCLQTNLTISTAVGGAPLTSTGSIDFTQSAVNGYQATYTVCGNNGLQTAYDIRWNISAVQSQGLGKLVTVSARQPFVAGQNGFAGILPVTLRTVAGI
jgi:Tfp pilus assembly protein PilV